MVEIKKVVKMPSTKNVVEKRGKTEAKRNTTVVQKCTCVSDFQDKVYGVGMRVKNSTGSGSGYRCTVCRK
jgi:hypothetical protein